MGKKFVITCGGTGGHIYPGIAVAQRLKSLMPDCSILFVGCKGNMEMEIVPREGFEIVSVDARSFHRSFAPRDFAHNISGVFINAASIGKSRKILKDFRADIAIGTGGYVCYPVLRAASKMKIPTIIHEANAIPGLTTRLLERVCDTILINFEECRQYYKHSTRLAVVGMPVRNGFSPENRTSKNSGELPRLVSLWGSLGAEHMNELTAELIAINEQKGAFTHIHATGGGEQGVAAMREKLAALGVTELRYTELQPYIYDMPQVMADADMVMCRSGASTLGEITAMGTPAVLVPSVNVTHNHQESNAKVLASAGAAILMLERDCTGNSLFECIADAINNKERLDNMSAVMRTLNKNDSAGLIVAETLDLIAKKSN